jgi:hypothetical protein
MEMSNCELSAAEMNFARQMAELMKSDKCDAAYISSSEQDQIEFVLAYAPAVVKKFNRFVNDYMTKNGAKSTFDSMVYELLKEMAQPLPV